MHVLRGLRLRLSVGRRPVSVATLSASLGRRLHRCTRSVLLTAPYPHRRSIEGAFPGAALEWKATATPTATGFLEVSVNGALVHSKKGGDGYVDTQAKTDKMCVPRTTSRRSGGALEASFPCGS